MSGDDLKPSYMPHLGISGRIAAYFQTAHITPLLALMAFLLGIFAIIVTPREEEPQIDVTMANVMIAFPGASARDVETMVLAPAEQVLSQISGVEHVMGVARTGVAMVTVQFKVGVARPVAMIRLYEAVGANIDWLPQGLGVMAPIIKPKGVDDVPIVTLTLNSTRAQTTALDLMRIAHSIETQIKRVSGTREIKIHADPKRVIMVEIEPNRLNAVGLTLQDLQTVLQSANMGSPIGDIVSGNRTVALEAGSFLQTVQDVADLVVGVQGGRPVYLRDLAKVYEGSPSAQHFAWYGKAQHNIKNSAVNDHLALTLSITKKPGENAIDVADAVMVRIQELRGTLIPDDIQISVTRNYGETANDKAITLIKKLLFATLAVVVLVFLTLGRREAAIVGVAVILTLMVTLFASWALGFTLNRVSLFALIFSIGILVDDAIVVVENIHRHQQMHPQHTLQQIIPQAVDEVGGPTVLATFTVIAALLPMAFVSGLMGPYMGPIPINASMGMLLSLVVAFVITPWLSQKWLKPSHTSAHELSNDAKMVHGETRKLSRLFDNIFKPLLDPLRGIRNRRLLGIGVGGLIIISLALPIFGVVILKMLPFDNKSEFQVLVDMPAGTPVEKTAAVLRTLSAYLSTVPEVKDYQAYAGTASPISFNGLVRQYDLRTGGEVGDIQVNLVDKAHRKAKSHAIAMRLRPVLQSIAQPLGANVKIVEVPPGPPVLSPLVAEVYGPNAQGRYAVAKAIRSVFEKTDNVVDVDDTTISAAPKIVLTVDRNKAATLGVTQQAVVNTLHMGLSGGAVTYLHDTSRYANAAWIQLPAYMHGDMNTLLQLTVRSQTGLLVPIKELVTISDSLREQPIYHKDLLPVTYVVGDVANTVVGEMDSPLYGMFRMRNAIKKTMAPDGQTIKEYLIQQPSDIYAGYAIKWDGEWQITYETFRDMGLAYGVGLILIYLLVVAQFGSYLVPLIIMAPIPLTVIGVMPGHALLGAQFTATSMIGMIALAGIIVRNSILLVDFIHLQLAQGVPLEQAIVKSTMTRAQPIGLTALAAMIGALFILDDPIFNGLAISLIFGILVSTVLTLVVIPILYYMTYRRQYTST